MTNKELLSFLRGMLTSDDISSETYPAIMALIIMVVESSVESPTIQIKP